MLTLLRTRRWIAFTLLVVAAIVAFGLLSRWQWSRAEERRVEQAALLAETASPAVPLVEALAAPQEWMPVTVTGTYDSASTRLIRQRPLNGANGFWVATLLIADRGDAVWVNRGWVAVTGTATQVQAPPAPPAGTVTVTGRLRTAERTPQPAPSDLPDGQASALDPRVLGSQITGYYVEVTASEPQDSGVTPIPLPQIDESRNVSYAVQWLLFAVVALAGWFFFLRREAREDALHVAKEATPSTSA